MKLRKPRYGRAQSLLPERTLLLGNARVWGAMLWLATSGGILLMASASACGKTSKGGAVLSENDGGGGSVGALEGGVATKLPPLPPLSNVVATLDDDSASITFDPVDGALDYRVYPLPADSDINVASDGQVTIHNAIYRCAGDRESPVPNVDTGFLISSDGVATLVDQQTVDGYLRTIADATVGYVYTQPGPGLVPVYVLGESDPNADTTCYFARWEQSRVKKYTTSQTEQAQLLAGRARDDGIAFYVPATPDATTTQIYIDENQPGTPYLSRYYFPDGAEAQVHPNKTPAFTVLAQPAPGAVPLMRVYYENECGWSHDELAVGQERFNRAYKQGDTQPWWSLLWSGITGPTTLVVEALDTGCPYQGLLASQSMPSVTDYNGTMPLIHQPLVTIDDVRAASATTEVFINGQHGPAWMWNGSGTGDGGVPEDAATAAQLLANTGAGLPLPKAVARSFVSVAPKPHATMDFFASFSPLTPPETFTDVANRPPSQECAQDWRLASPTFDVHFVCIDQGPTPGTGFFAFGPVMGELWLDMADNGADTNGKFRLTAEQKASISSSTFLHVTMEVDSYSTARRYPQILISDQDIPVQYNLPNGHTIIVQPRGETTPGVDYPIDMDLQICNLRTWDVNNQCPQYDLYHLMDDAGAVVNLAPNDELGEHASVDHRVLYDVFASTQRVYIFLDGEPYSCANLPTVGPPAPGPVTVTWGDVLYHSGVDHTYAFHTAHLQIETRRHFDNLGFSSGVPAPSWDESRFPCVAPITL